MSTDEKIHAEALAGPWVAVLAARDGWLVVVDDEEDDPKDVQIVIVRRSAAPVDHYGTDRLPGSYASPDHLVRFDDFEDWVEVRTRWVQAQAMVAGLNAAAAPAVPAGGAQA
jgi:hypothetical protein